MKFKNFICNRLFVAIAIAIIGMGSMLFNSPYVNVLILFFTSAAYVILTDGYLNKPNNVEKAFQKKIEKYLPKDIRNEQDEI